MHGQLSLYTSYTEGDRPIFLPNGAPIVKSLIDKWHEMHREMGFLFLHTFGLGEQKLLHRRVFEREGYPLGVKLASMAGTGEDGASIFCKREVLREETISSLHFLDQTIKIFGFETKVYCIAERGEKRALVLKEGLEEKKIRFKEELFSGGDDRVEFRVLDRSGKEWRGPCVALPKDEKGEWIYRSLFGSLERWVLLMMEQAKK